MSDSSDPDSGGQQLPHVDQSLSPGAGSPPARLSRRQEAAAGHLQAEDTLSADARP